MNRTILFSPVGGTDPIHNKNCRDGSMLHIARVYEATDVFLYMSKEILENHKKDNRYFYALEKLAELQEREIRIKEIARPDLIDVHEYDYYYNDFADIINEIKNGMDETDRLILNVSSGTPAMKNGLLILQQMLDMEFTPVQVRTPEGKMNEHVHSSYDIDELWELNPDNEDDFENRCSEVYCKSFIMIKNEEMIKKNIRQYNYDVALELANMMPERSKKYLPLIKMARDRVILDTRELESTLKELEGHLKDIFTPIRKDGIREVYEYALSLNIKFARKDYDGFIRAMTPLIVKIFESILDAQCGIQLNKYLKTNKKGFKEWDRNKLKLDVKGERLDSCLNNNFHEFKYNYIQSVHVKAIVEDFSNDEKLIALVKKIRRIEEKIRNIVAHDIFCVTDDSVKKRTGYYISEILSFLMESFKYTNFNISKDNWNSYDVMNDYIIKVISEG